VRGVRLVRLPRVLRPLRGQSLSFLQQAQHPVTHHPQQPLHLCLRRRRQRLEAHAALSWHEDAVWHQRVEVRRHLQGRAEELDERDSPNLPIAQTLPPPPPTLRGRTPPAGTTCPSQSHLARAHATDGLPRASMESLAARVVRGATRTARQERRILDDHRPWLGTKWRQLPVPHASPIEWLSEPRASSPKCLQDWRGLRVTGGTAENSPVDSKCPDLLATPRKACAVAGWGHPVSTGSSPLIPAKRLLSTINREALHSHAGLLDLSGSQEAPPLRLP
jgi:hypothetical protein